MLAISRRLIAVVLSLLLLSGLTVYAASEEVITFGEGFIMFSSLDAGVIDDKLLLCGSTGVIDGNAMFALVDRYGNIQKHIDENGTYDHAFYRSPIDIGKNRAIILKKMTVGKEYSASLVELFGAQITRETPLPWDVRSLFAAKNGFFLWYDMPKGTPNGLVRMNADGSILWERELDRKWQINGMISVEDGYFIYGAAIANSQGSFRGLIAKIDEEGNILWHHIREDVSKMIDGDAISKDEVMLLCYLDISGDSVMAHYSADGLLSSNFFALSEKNPSAASGFVAVEDGYVLNARNQKPMHGFIRLVRTDSQGLPLYEWMEDTQPQYTCPNRKLFIIEDEVYFVGNGTMEPEENSEVLGECITVIRRVNFSDSQTQ